jgi:cytidyltransferase-like protein
MGKTIAITSMYANPLHPGHVECLELSKALTDELWVIVNNDKQTETKRGVKSFQDETFRMRVVEALKPVNVVVLSIDEDGSVVKMLEALIKVARLREDVSEIIFTKGGDRFAAEIPERALCERLGVRIVDGLGAKTHNSSSYVHHMANSADEGQLRAELAKLLEEAKEKDYLEVGVRPWGVYYVLEDRPDYKVKKIIVTPGHRLSLQSHEKRSVHWVVVSGTASVEIRDKKHPKHVGHRIVEKNESCYVPQGHLHRLSNMHEEPLVIIEVQSGAYTGEDDIVRYEDDYARAGWEGSVL